MNYESTYLTKSIFFGTCLALACAGGGTLGCGDSDAPTGVMVESELFGIYRVTQYQQSPTDCNAPEIANPPAPYVALYSFNPDGDLEEARLGGAFCADPDVCRLVVQAAVAPPIGYSFLTGDDASGWLGFAVPTGGPAGDQCRADVQAHTMTSLSADAIHVETKTSQPIFMPTLGGPDGNTATCSTADALEAWNEDLPCTAIILLDATFEMAL